jgi:hypothetical protein
MQADGRRARGPTKGGPYEWTATPRAAISFDSKPISIFGGPEMPVVAWHSPIAGRAALCSPSPAAYRVAVGCAFAGLAAAPLPFCSGSPLAIDSRGLGRSAPKQPDVTGMW